MLGDSDGLETRREWRLLNSEESSLVTWRATRTRGEELWLQYDGNVSDVDGPHDLEACVLYAYMLYMLYLSVACLFSGNQLE